MQPASSNYLKGAAFGFAAVSVWASWSVVTRLAVTTSLDAWDIVALRFGVAGLLLWPVLVRRGLALDRLGWFGLGVLIAGNGVPYALVAATGLHFAPAYDGGALNPGCLPLFVALIATIVMGEKISTTRILGLSLILVGAVTIVGWHAEGRDAAWSTSRTFGDVLFLIAAFLTACFTLVMRQAKLDPLHAVALVSTGSLVIYLPIYLALYGAGYGAGLARIPLADLAIQALFQGVAVTIIRSFCTVAQLSSSALRVAQPSEHWCRRCRHCSRYRSSGSGQPEQIGSASSSSPPASIWRAEHRCRGGGEGAVSGSIDCRSLDRRHVAAV